MSVNSTRSVEGRLKWVRPEPIGSGGAPATVGLEQDQQEQEPECRSDEQGNKYLSEEACKEHHRRHGYHPPYRNVEVGEAKPSTGFAEQRRLVGEVGHLGVFLAPSVVLLEVFPERVLPDDHRLDLEVGDELHVVDRGEVVGVDHRHREHAPHPPEGKHQMFGGDIGRDQLQDLLIHCHLHINYL